MDATIEALEVVACTVPTDSPEADGTLAWDATTIVVARACAGGERGLGYTYADLAAAPLIEHRLAPLVVGRDATGVPRIAEELRRAVRNLGRPGVAACAISAVDAALWDLKARLVGLPLATLLGAARDAVPVYGSGGFTTDSIERLQAQLAGWVERGIPRVKMKVGAEPARDAERVRAAREAIGPEAELFVDANGAYQRKQALAMAERFREEGVSWFEEPVRYDDLCGLRLLRDRAPAGMEIAAGEYGYTPADFRALLETGAVDVLQADATRCMGITGFLLAGALCAAHALPLSAHTAPALHVPLGCALPAVRHLEYFHDHVRIEELLFEGVPVLQRGALAPDPHRPGLGLRLRRAEARRFAVYGVP